MTLNIDEEIHPDFNFNYNALAKSVIETAIEEEQFPFEAEISLTLTDNRKIQEINLMYRKIDAPTDVLSFPLIEYKASADFSEIELSDDNFNPDTGEAMLGDIVVSVDKVFSQAEEFGHSVEREFAFLILHSMLHLFGYDHMTKEDAAIMENKQETILESLNVLR
ncbi:MAG: rRNA maturation RNase YbeY [Lachnospiraceae bacterium]